LTVLLEPSRDFMPLLSVQWLNLATGHADLQISSRIRSQYPRAQFEDGRR
jgi:hypothetical protein